MILEACVNNLEDALKAEQNGAHQIELCSQLELDGLTPSRELILACKSELNIPIHAMIRPRAGNFVHSSGEIETMLQEIKMCKDLNVEGVVFGVLNEDHTIDMEALRRLCEEAKPMLITFHKAIDACSNIMDEMIRLDQANLVDQLLTSGGEPTAMEGASILKKMVDAATNLDIKVAGKVTQKNLSQLSTLTGAMLFHGKKIV